MIVLESKHGKKHKMTNLNIEWLTGVLCVSFPTVILRKGSERPVSSAAINARAL